MNYFLLAILFFYVLLTTTDAASKKKPHPHKGILEPYDGKPIPYTITTDQAQKLDKGEPVVFKDFKKFGGKGVVVQDINAPTSICMDAITDLSKYSKRVPRVKHIDIYEQKKFANGTMKTHARFDVSVVGAKFSYFVLCTQEPKYKTFTWTLDYKYNSDFDDSVGHWQVQKHPSKKDWSRVLYSTKAKLGAWVPNFVINVIIKSALTESTTWVKKESEAMAKNLKSHPTNKLTFPQPSLTLPSWAKLPTAANKWTLPTFQKNACISKFIENTKNNKQVNTFLKTTKLDQYFEPGKIEKDLHALKGKMKCGIKAILNPNTVIKLPFCKP